MYCYAYFMYLWDYSVYTLEYAEFNMKPKKIIIIK